MSLTEATASTKALGWDENQGVLLSGLPCMSNKKVELDVLVIYRHYTSNEAHKKEKNNISFGVLILLLEKEVYQLLHL